MQGSIYEGSRRNTISKPSNNNPPLDMSSLNNDFGQQLDSLATGVGSGSLNGTTNPSSNFNDSNRSNISSSLRSEMEMSNNLLKNTQNDTWTSTVGLSVPENQEAMNFNEGPTGISSVASKNNSSITSKLQNNSNLSVTSSANRGRTSSVSSSYDPSFPWGPRMSSVSSGKQHLSSLSLHTHFNPSSSSTVSSDSLESSQQKAPSSSSTATPASAASEIISNKDPVVEPTHSASNAANSGSNTIRARQTTRTRSNTLPWSPRVFGPTLGYNTPPFGYPPTTSSALPNASGSSSSFFGLPTAVSASAGTSFSDISPAAPKASLENNIASNASSLLNPVGLDHFSAASGWSRDFNHLPASSLATARSSLTGNAKSGIDSSVTGMPSDNYARVVESSTAEFFDPSLASSFGLTNYRTKPLTTGFNHPRPQGHGLNTSLFNTSSGGSLKSPTFEVSNRLGDVDTVPDLPPLGSLSSRPKPSSSSRRRSQSLSAMLKTSNPYMPSPSLLSGSLANSSEHSSSPRLRGSPIHNQPVSSSKSTASLNTNNNGLRASTPEMANISTRSSSESNNTNSWPTVGDATIENLTQHEPTHALWVGNLPSGVSATTVATTFSAYGTVSSIRMLSHKHSAFLNFDSVETAKHVLEELNGKRIFFGSDPVCISFAKVASSSSESSHSAVDGLNKAFSNVSFVPSLREVYDDLINVVQSFGFKDLSKIYQILNAACELTDFAAQIPSISKAFSSRRLNAPKLRQVRKRIDNGLCTQEEVEDIAINWLDEVSDLSSDHLGNTVVQKLFDYCSDPVKEMMLERIAPHLAQIGIHKNGTWAAQKIVDVASTEAQMRLIAKHLQPYIPLLFADQFGNYVVQTCLKFGAPMNDFVFEAILNQFWVIAQSRYGSRAVRACLESPDVTEEQRVLVAAAITVYSVHLAMNGNGTLLLTYLVENMNYPHIPILLTRRFVQDIVRVCTHRLAYNSLLKIISIPQGDTACGDLVVDAILDTQNDLNPNSLEKILFEQTYGPSFICKLLTHENISASHRQQLQSAVRNVLGTMEDRGSSELKKLAEVCA